MISCDNWDSFSATEAILEAVVLCHCDDCRRRTGAAFSVNVLVAREVVEITGRPAS
jgi:hypothetical protein